MIQCVTVRAIALAILLSGVAHAEEVAIYWQPPGEVPSVREAFTQAMAPTQVIDATAPVAAAASLVPELEAAKALYAKFAFAETIARLDQLSRLADARGGGDLDARQLSEIFFYRGLARLESGAAEAAWEDLVRAARLDPSRVVDPARYPPRAVAAYRRAVAEVAQLQRGTLTLEVPAGSIVLIDGAAAAGAVTLGPHFVSVQAQGYEPWAGVVSVAGLDHFAPPLHGYRPPDVDRVAPASAKRIWYGALERNGSSWRFVVREIAEGKSVSQSLTLGEVPAAQAIAVLVGRMRPVETPAPPQQPKRRWWVWAVAGGLALGVVVVGLGVGLGTSSSTGQVGGALESIK
jgi:hypothetical protein